MIGVSQLAKKYGSQNRYVPDRGDIVKFDFDPTLGREQAGYRPALVITEKGFNKATGLALVCPITSKIKGFNLEVVLPDGLNTTGVILAFQLKTVDWVESQIKYVESVPAETMEEVASKLHTLIG
jgi:mRNA interferase MazF